MNNHNTHILSDGTSINNSYKYDNLGNLIIDSFDNCNYCNNEGLKKEEVKSENIFTQNSNNLIINNYDKDIDYNITELINIKTIGRNNINEINKKKKYNNMEDKINEKALKNDENKGHNNELSSLINLKIKIKENNNNISIEKKLKNDKKENIIDNNNKEEEKVEIKDKENNKIKKKDIINIIGNKKYINENYEFNNNKENYVNDEKIYIEKQVKNNGQNEKINQNFFGKEKIIIIKDILI